MKAIVTLFFVLFIGVCAQAQATSKPQQLKIVPVKITSLVLVTNGLNLKSNTIIARLYIDKNAKVNKELAFVTARNKSKLV